ncbi:MAG: methyltransferase domain-containing protein [Sphingomicrobium sp.]
MRQLFDMRIREMRRDRAARNGVELFLYERAFADCLERLELTQRRFSRALLVGCPDPTWPERLVKVADQVDVRDPGSRFAERSAGTPLVEDAWLPTEAAYDLALAIGTLDSVNDLPLALRLLRHALEPNALLMGAVCGGDTLPQLRSAMRAADATAGAAMPHVHPRIEAAAFAPLLETAGFSRPVVDVDRVPVSYRSFERLIDDLRAMAGTNMLTDRPRYIGRAARDAAVKAFTAAGEDSRTVETFEILHFAAWTPKET